MGEDLPEVTLLRDARPRRPENAVGFGDFWYEPEVWDLPVSPTARVLYTGLCSFLGHGEINRRDLQNTLKYCSDAKIAEALEKLVHHNLLDRRPTPGDGPSNLAVLSVQQFEG